jgi:hypothetical protein
LADDVRTASRTSPSTCQKIKYSNRNDTTGSCLPSDHRWSATQPEFWNPTRGPTHDTRHSLSLPTHGRLGSPIRGCRSEQQHADHGRVLLPAMSTGISNGRAAVGASAWPRGAQRRQSWSGALLVVRPSSMR